MASAEVVDPLGRADHADSGQPAGATPVAALASTFAALATSLYAGLAVGLVTLGVGLRLAMRVSMLAAGESARGRLTDNGNLIGEVTLDGTGFLLLAGTALGGVFGVAHLVARRWLPASGSAPTRGLVFGVALLLVTRGLFVDDANHDFALLEPRALNVVMYAALPLLFAAAFVPFRGWVAERFPAPRWRSWVLLLYLPLPVFLFGPMFGLPILAAAAAGAWAVASRPHWFRWWQARPVTVLGQLALVAAAAVGGVEFVRRILAIL